MQATKNSFKCMGEILKIDKREGVTNGKKYQKINIMLGTSEYNTVFLDLFGVERNNVVFMKEQQKIIVPWRDRINFAEKNNDYRLIGGVNVDKTIVTAYDAVNKIVESFIIGDKVWVSGNIDYRIYKSQTIYSLVPTLIYHNSSGELEQEINDFEQEMIFKDIVDNVVNGFVLQQIKKDKLNAVPVSFTVRNGILKQKMQNTLNLGDRFKLYGKIHNRLEFVNVDLTEVDMSWGYIPDSYKQAVKTRRKEMELVGVDPQSIIPKYCSLDDLLKLQVNDEVFDDLEDINLEL